MRPESSRPEIRVCAGRSSGRRRSNLTQEVRRILLLLAGAAILGLPAAAAARPHGHRPAPGFLVVRSAATDGGVTGNPVATVVVRGFVLGRIAQEGKVQLFQLSSSAITPQVAGVAISRRAVTWRGRVRGAEYSGSDFRFRAVGGVWRVVVYGAGVSLYAGGQGTVSLHGQVAYPQSDGEYSFDGGRFVSLPSGMLRRRLGVK